MWGRLSVAKPPHAAPGLAARGSTAVAPRHKGAPCPTGRPAPCPHVSVRSRHTPLSERVRAQCRCPRRRMSTSASSVPPRRRHRRLPSATEADRPLHSDSAVAVRSTEPARPELRATRRWPPMPRPPSPASPPRGPSSSLQTSPSHSSLRPSRLPLIPAQLLPRQGCHRARVMRPPLRQQLPTPRHSFSHLQDLAPHCSSAATAPAMPSRLVRHLPLPSCAQRHR
jgi:hypothetical protein